MIDFSQVENEIDNIVSFFEQEEEIIVATTLKKRIIERTLNGVDVNGSSFIPYSPKYSKYGRLNKGLSTSPVDLWALGQPHLLESIFLTNHTLWFPSEMIPIAQGNQSRREFFAVNSSDWQEAANAVAIAYNQKYGRA